VSATRAAFAARQALYESGFMTRGRASVDSSTYKHSVMISRRNVGWRV